MQQLSRRGLVCRKRVYNAMVEQLVYMYTCINLICICAYVYICIYVHMHVYRPAHACHGASGCEDSLIEFSPSPTLPLGPKTLTKTPRPLRTCFSWKGKWLHLHVTGRSDTLKKQCFFAGFGDRLPAESNDTSPRTVPCPCQRPPGQPDVDRYKQIQTDMDR